MTQARQQFIPISGAAGLPGMQYLIHQMRGNQQQNNGLLNADPASIAGQAQTYMGTGLQNRMPGFSPLLNNTENITNVDNNEGRQQYIPVSPTLSEATPIDDENLKGRQKYIPGQWEGTTHENAMIQEYSTKLNEAVESRPKIPPGVAARRSEKTDITDTTDKQKWYQNIGGIVQNFLDNLDDPTFQTVLKMHTEAKDGGDIVDVLQAGVTHKQKVTDALLQAKANETSLVKQNLGIIDLLSKIGATEAPSTNLIKAANELLSKNPYDLGDQTTEAAFAMSSMAKALQAQSPSTYPDEYSALMGAIQLAEGSGGITKDTWLSWGGKFSPENIQPIQTQSIGAMYPTSYKDALTRYENEYPDASKEEIEASIQANFPWLVKI